MTSMALNVIHPCGHWAQLAGYASWRAALDAMRAGKVVVASGPRSDKSTLGVTLFLNEVRSEGLHCYWDDFGRAWLGLKENFSKAILDRQEADRQLHDLTRGLF